MGKVPVAKRSVRTASYSYWRPVVRPKIHIIDQGIQVPSSRSSLKNREGSEAKNDRNPNKHHLATRLSVAIHAVALSVVLYMIVLDTLTFIKHPTGTGVEDDMFGMENVDFPGVAICNMNIMSKEAVISFADKIWEKEEIQAIGNMTREKVRHLMTYLGHLVLFEKEEAVPGDLMLCNKILKIALKSDSFVEEMEDLSPQCGSFMENCSWEGSLRQCHELFTQRWTQDGYCCTFNYVRWTDRISSVKDTDFKIKVVRSVIPGQCFGLQVHLRPQIDDRFYNILPGNGFKILIYTASDYPDAPSGGVREILIIPGTENFLHLRAISFHSSPASDVIQYDKSKRKCLFSTELYEIYNGFYSYSQCMMLCRVRDIHKICGCVPFFYPIPHDIGNVTKCQVSDLPCLREHRSKWWSVKTEHTELNENAYKGDRGGGYFNANLACDCLPACETIYYSVFKTSSKIRNYNPDNVLGKIDNFTTDNVYLTLSFQATSTVRLRQDALFQWYDLMSNYSGLCSLFLGMSIITPIELTYLLCTRLWSRWKKNRPVQKQRSPAEPVEMNFRERPIYWKEIIPSERSY